MDLFTVLASLSAGASAGALGSNIPGGASSLATFMPSAEVKSTAIGALGITAISEITCAQTGASCADVADPGAASGGAPGDPENADSDDAEGTPSKRRVYGDPGASARASASASAGASAIASGASAAVRIATPQILQAVVPMVVLLAVV